MLKSIAGLFAIAAICQGHPMARPSEIASDPVDEAPAIDLSAQKAHVYEDNRDRYLEWSRNLGQSQAPPTLFVGGDQGESTQQRDPRQLQHPRPLNQFPAHHRGVQFQPHPQPLIPQPHFQPQFQPQFQSQPEALPQPPVEAPAGPMTDHMLPPAPSTPLSGAYAERLKGSSIAEAIRLSGSPVAQVVNRGPGSYGRRRREASEEVPEEERVGKSIPTGEVLVGEEETEEAPAFETKLTGAYKDRLSAGLGALARARALSGVTKNIPVESGGSYSGR